MAKRKTHEQFLQELNKHGKLRLLDDQLYEGVYKKLWFECKHGHRVLTTPKDVSRGSGCVQCRKKPTKTHKEFVNEVKKIEGVYLTEKSKYVNSKTPVEFTCDKGHLWSCRPHNILNGTKCPTCAGVHTKTTEEFNNECMQNNTKLRLCDNEKYINNKTKLKFKCSKGHINEVVPHYVLSGGGCSTCSKKKRKTTKSFMKELFEKHGDEVKLVENQQYVNIVTKLKFVCNHGHEWNARPKDVLVNKSKCPHCRKRPYSKKAIEWMNRIMEQECIHIQHAENEGEYLVPNTNYKVDGYCSVTNTIYEFHGSAFHGNPKIYKPKDRCHPYDRKLTAGYLYKKTKERIQELKQLGFNVIEMWESDY